MDSKTNIKYNIMNTLTSPLISIIVATYNASACITQALESIINQSFQSWECIVQDGGSKDNTLSILQKYASLDNRIKYYSEPDKGIFDALNKGIQKAQGQWIYVLGSDDILNSNAFTLINNYLNEENDIVYGKIEIVFPNKSKKIVSPQNIRSIRYMMIANHQSIIMKKALIDKLNGFNDVYKISADFDLVQRAYLLKSKFLEVDVCFAKFSYTGVSSHFSFKKQRDHYLICKRNKANSCPLLYHLFVEGKHILGFLHKKYIQKSI